MTSPSRIQAAMQLRVCPRCVVQFMYPRQDLLPSSDEEISILIANYQRDHHIDSTDYNHNSASCPCCLNTFSPLSIDSAVNLIVDKLGAAASEKISVSFAISPIVDVTRTTVRTIVTLSNVKTFPFPAANVVMDGLVQYRLRSLGYNIVEEADAKFRVSVMSILSQQYAVCAAIAPDHNVTLKKKRKLDEQLAISTEASDVVLDSSTHDWCEISKSEGDSLLSHLKTLDTTSLNILADNIKSQCNIFVAQATTWKIEVSTPPVYLLGRYLKFARDVPQAAWTADGQRKGRNSVEEIVAEAVSLATRADGVKMHSCGREDIDVRCLGNGRPFVLEVRNSAVECTIEVLGSIVACVNSRNGLNSEGDVALLMLQTADKDTWSNMQAIAEEKRKAYRCVVWCSEPVQTDRLHKLHELISQMPEDSSSSDRSLKISQRTPLRVLHRRSLIDRPRDIYYLSAVPLNPHFFILDLITSAGTYVKEFVHGDMGRTTPNIGSILGCQADILQLDVIYLFDEFEGGGKLSDFIRHKTMREHPDRSRDHGMTLAGLEYSSNLSYRRNR